MLWFQENPPISGIGKIKLAEMLIKNNFVEEGYWLLNETWINHTLFLFQKKNIFLINFKRLYLKNLNFTKRMEKLSGKNLGVVQKTTKKGK